MKPEIQQKLDEQFALTYPHLVEFAHTHTYVSKIHTEKYEEFKKGFVSGLRVSGMSEYEITGEGLAGYMIKLEDESLETALSMHRIMGGQLYDTVDEAKVDGERNAPEDGDYEIYSVTYKNKGDAPDFKLEYR